MKRAVKISAVFLAAVCAVILGTCARLSGTLPNEVSTFGNDRIAFENLSVFNFNTVFVKRQSNTDAICAYSGQTVAETRSDCYDGEIDLFGVIPIKQVTVHREEKRYAVPCGELFGIKFYAKGASVIECCDIPCGEETVNPGKSCGLREGDTILAINGQKIGSYRDVEEYALSSEGRSLRLSCLRGGRSFETEITPVLTDAGYRLGLWIRDSAAGLGTMTFYDPKSGRFASLGHGICDDDTQQLLQLDRAEITKVEVAGITKGADGFPGSINGYFSDESPLGSADRNSEFGLYGELFAPPSGLGPTEIAPIHEVTTGRAQILCTLGGEGPELYDIEITHVNYDESNKTKNLQITARDDRLLDKTGGIIQGMSGSPILQNGKLVGAVTHVLVTNSAKGYGIFAQNMFDEMEKSCI